MLWTLWNKDLRSVVIQEGGIKIIKDGALVGTVGMIGETVGLGYQYDGSVTSAAAVAAIHKANLATHTTDLASQLGSINYLNEQKNLHAATLASHGSTLSAHGTELSSQAGSIGVLSGYATAFSGQIGTLQSQMAGVQSGLSGAQGAISSLQGAVGSQGTANSNFQASINALISDVNMIGLKISRLESWARNGGGPGGPPFNDGA
ncbi:hypothetical protein [Pseudoclavibacter sp. VKM Ac-2888]|uniref:hypothetical protein n=1 Tax=Pseudoclavibacter sp. VKM Ac-2888 TaxID=2783830 RepID=UPI00188D99B1|nr:hypothetical protein [Pseudoclavibacter sp. VKM Ac-2888]MBF4549664.1 hypothetical protein [Pseudoclavibacter sp. VKM Ac-2888]